MTTKEINLKTINNESILGRGNITVGGGSADIVTSWESTLSDEKVPSEKLTKDTLDTKISKSSTSGLVKNDGTIDTTSYSTFSGSYSDLSNKPSIPSSSSDLSDGSDIIKKSNTSGLVKNDGTIDTTSYVSDVSGKEDTSNKVTSWSSTTTDTHYPSEKLTKDSLDGKQATLVSGTNIKTINNESLLGSGNITVSGGADVGTFTDLQALITNASSGDVITLTKDYKYDSTTDSSLTSGIVVDKNITINANGHIIDGNNTCMAFSMTGASNNKLTLTLENIIVQNCNSANGAIYITQYCTLNIIDSIFDNNTSTTNGGAIYGYVRCTINIYNSTFSNNKATNGVGGAIYAQNYPTLTINASTFINNTASSEGGAICTSWYPNFTLLHSRIEYNSANKGGGLQIGNANVGTFNVRNNIITSNTANTFANVVVYNGSVSAYNCILLDNASTYSNFNNYKYVDTNLIVDNLTTSDATKVLSAKQGKALYDAIAGIENDMLS